MKKARGNEAFVVRPMAADELHLVVEYFHNSTQEFLNAMAVEKARLPEEKDWVNDMQVEFDKAYRQKSLFYMIGLFNDVPVGHSNINQIVFGDRAYMHLHIWKDEFRGQGLGRILVTESLRCYFKYFGLKSVFCEPFALNPGPNRTVNRLGFEFVKCHETIPGRISVLQMANLWVMTKAKFDHLYGLS